MSRYVVEDLFGIEGWNIAWYGVIIGVGFLLGIALAVYRANRLGIDKELIFDFALLAVPVAVACARAYYVVFEWERYADNPIKVLAVWEGGLAIYGGILGGLLAAILFCKQRRFQLLLFLDLRKH